MSYTEENKKLQEEVAKLQESYDALNEYFKQNPLAKHNNSMLGYSANRYMLEKQAEHYDIFPSSGDSDDYIAFQIIAVRLARAKYRLNQSKAGRAISDGIEFMGSITPQHVSGRLYKVENGDGCGMFCLWFIIIDAIIIFIFYLIHG